MSWFKKKPKQDKYELYKVYITYEVLVNAKNEIQAINAVRELRNDLWACTRKYVLKFAIMESAKAKR